MEAPRRRRRAAGRGEQRHRHCEIVDRVGRAMASSSLRSRTSIVAHGAKS
jgi:hypothetical protein